MNFVWDERKRQTNLRKHGFDFRDAFKLFQGETVTVLDDREDYGEDRFVTLGLLNNVVVAIVHAEVTDTIRIISMRKATYYEESAYFEQIGD